MSGIYNYESENLKYVAILKEGTFHQGKEGCGSTPTLYKCRLTDKPCFGPDCRICHVPERGEIKDIH